MIKYSENYGVLYPESHIIRFYNSYVKPKIKNKEKYSVLDFGCGNGTHAIYFLSEEYLSRLCMDLNELLEDDGMVYFTRMGKKNYYYDKSLPFENKVRQVNFGKGDQYILFCDDKKDVNKLFNTFKPVFTGYYDYETPSGSTLHYYFIGGKNR